MGKHNKSQIYPNNPIYNHLQNNCHHFSPSNNMETKKVTIPLRESSTIDLTTFRHQYQYVYPQLNNHSMMRMFDIKKRLAENLLSTYRPPPDYETFTRMKAAKIQAAPIFTKIVTEIQTNQMNQVQQISKTKHVNQSNKNKNPSFASTSNGFKRSTLNTELQGNRDYQKYPILNDHKIPQSLSYDVNTITNHLNDTNMIIERVNPNDNLLNQKPLSLKSNQFEAVEQIKQCKLDLLYQNAVNSGTDNRSLLFESLNPKTQLPNFNSNIVSDSGKNEQNLLNKSEKFHSSQTNPSPNKLDSISNSDKTLEDKESDRSKELNVWINVDFNLQCTAIPSPSAIIPDSDLNSFSPSLDEDVLNSPLNYNESANSNDDFLSMNQIYMTDHYDEYFNENPLFRNESTTNDVLKEDEVVSSIQTKCFEPFSPIEVPQSMENGQLSECQIGGLSPDSGYGCSERSPLRPFSTNSHTSSNVYENRTCQRSFSTSSSNNSDCNLDSGQFSSDDLHNSDIHESDDLFISNNANEANVNIDDEGINVEENLCTKEKAKLSDMSKSAITAESQIKTSSVEKDEDQEYEIDYLIYQANIDKRINVFIKWTGYDELYAQPLTKEDRNGPEYQRFSHHMKHFRIWQKHLVSKPELIAEFLKQQLLTTRRLLPKTDKLRIKFENFCDLSAKLRYEHEYLYIYNMIILLAMLEYDEEETDSEDNIIYTSDSREYNIRNVTLPRYSIDEMKEIVLYSLEIDKYLAENNSTKKKMNKRKPTKRTNVSLDNSISPTNGLSREKRRTFSARNTSPIDPNHVAKPRKRSKTRSIGIEMPPPSIDQTREFLENRLTLHRLGQLNIEPETTFSTV